MVVTCEMAFAPDAPAYTAEPMPAVVSAPLELRQRIAYPPAEIVAFDIVCVYEPTADWFTPLLWNAAQCAKYPVPARSATAPSAVIELSIVIVVVALKSPDRMYPRITSAAVTPVAAVTVTVVPDTAEPTPTLSMDAVTHSSQTKYAAAAGVTPDALVSSSANPCEADPSQMIGSRPSGYCITSMPPTGVTYH